MIGPLLTPLSLLISILPLCGVVLSIIALNRAKRLENRLNALIETLRPRTEPGKDTPHDTPVPASLSILFPEPAKTATAPVEVHPVPPPVKTDPFPPPETFPPQPAPRPPHAIDWEKFTAGKLMSWIGGFALFLGAIFFAKYSIDHGLISPTLRVALGFLIGTGAVVAGLKLARPYAVTGQTLAASGAAILYAVTFACHSLYQFIGPAETFLFLSLVTVLAFLLSARLDSRYIALLALAGGFLVPPLVSTGVDRPIGLFTYVSLLDAGLLALVTTKRWGFLWGWATAGTCLMMAGWWNKFYGPDKTAAATIICLWFPFFFAAARAWVEKRNTPDRWTLNGAGVMALLSIVLGALALFGNGIQETPIPSFVVLLVSNLVTAWLATRHADAQKFHLAAGGLTFFTLLGWTEKTLTPETLPAALGAYLAFGGLHGALSFVLYRRGAPKSTVILGHLFPVALLVPLALGLLKDFGTPALVWPVVFGLNAIALLAAFATGFLWAALAALGMTFLAVWVWIPRLIPGNLEELLAVIGAMTIVFFAAGCSFVKRSNSSTSRGNTVPPVSWTWPDPWKILLPALSGILPYFLLAAAATHLRPENPAGLFGLAALLSVLLLGLVWTAGRPAEALGGVALAGAAMVQYAWNGIASLPESSLVGLPWFVEFSLIFFVLPFAFPKRLGNFRTVWIASALSGPVHFLLFYRTALRLNLTPFIGALPAAWAALYLGAIPQAKRKIVNDAHRLGLLAVFGAVALFFITLIFPLQFDKQWITLGWALEGVALLWLHRRIPHDGLKIWALGLLAVAFARLALNPAVFSYHPRAETRIFNWYLYAFGVVTLCQFMAARLWPNEDSSSKPGFFAPLLSQSKRITTAFGTILLFLLLNIEIADFFSTGTTITFTLRGSLSQDLAYTLAWGFFGFGLLWVGLANANRPARWSGLGVLGVTVGKLFLHDVWRLPLLYRSAAFAGLALLLISGSFVYQRFQNKSLEVRP